MFGQILYTQIKWSRASLAVLSVLAFTAPSAIWRTFHGTYYGTASAMEVLAGFGILGTALSLLAFLSGFVMVAHAWQVDAAAKHVYPLSLPLPWSRYVMMRFGAGALLLLVPAIALLLGSLLILALIDIPNTLRAYPFGLAGRFLLGSLVGYALTFTLQYLSGRSAAKLLLGILVAFATFAIGAETFGKGDWVGLFLTSLFEFPGPLGVFGAEWMLIDV
jgi:hypothetical protein